MLQLAEEKVKIINVGLLGMAFMLTFTAFNTMGNIQTTIMNSAKNQDSKGYVPGFNGDGFIALAVVYASFSLFNWFAPSVVSILGPRITLVVGGVIYSLYIAQIIYPNVYLLYGGALLLGIGAAIIWTAQGNFLTLNSDPSTMSRNSGVFWAMLQMSMLIGNTFVFFTFQGKTDIDKSTRTMVVLVLLSICIVGSLSFLLLRPTPWATDSAAAEGPVQILKSSWNLFWTKQMLMLSVTFFYTGLLLSFWSGVFGPSIANTKAFGSNANSYNGLHGIFVGVGEILGGLCFGILGHVLVKHGRDPVVLTGFVSSMAAFFLAFINLPAAAPLGATTDDAFITSNVYLALFTSFLLGFGDSCYNTQIYSILGSSYPDQSSSAFAIFKFVQSTSAALAFFYSNLIELPYQLLILVILGIAGTISFCLVEWRVHRLSVLKRLNDESPDHIDTACGVLPESNEEEDGATVVTHHNNDSPS